MRSRFDEQLVLLNKNMIEMGAMCEKAIDLAAQALAKGSTEIAAGVPPISEEINHLERDIESMCLKLLLQQQPVARDLRQISAALKMITDMERIGVQASDISEIIPYIKGHSGVEYSAIGEMAAAAIKMVTESIDAFVKKDVSLAKSVITYDDVVDDYFDKIKTSLIEFITKNPTNGEYALDLLIIAKYFERIGDHAVNIAEWVVFSVTGIHKEADV